ncbi:MAG TPA: ribonuclease R [Clostridiaceae bacterium]|nr:ribonuclease R [Clostridiaceae bacterium]
MELSGKLAERRERILAFMREKAYKPLSFTELSVVLDVPHEDLDQLRMVLESLESDGLIFRTKKNRYGTPEKMNLIVGRFQGSERGYGFVIPDDQNIKDIFISVDNTGGAMHNDRVVARINKKGYSDRRAEGEIIRIISRANNTIVGTFECSRYFGFVIPDNTKISGDIFIPKDEFGNAKPGDKVVAEIVKWPEARRNAEGRIIEVLGSSKDTGVDVLSIIKTYNLKEEFPFDVVQQASSIPQEVTEDMIKDRRDLRNLRMVTIDGEDAKDLDDAVSIEKLSNGIYKLGVHIADVSYYVKENSPLDKEALRRGTSVYLVDRVIPMLPRELSNGICSLNAKTDRLAFSVIMDIDSTGKVINHEIFESVINVSERMTYTDVYKILELEDKELMERYKDLVEDFKTMKELALILNQKRMARGAINFDFDEAKIIVDENGRPIDIQKYEITIANQIIEEFMLVCNETIAEHFYWADVPFIYRIHEDPDSEKISAFAEFVATLGYRLKSVNKIHPRVLQDLLEDAKGTKEEKLISSVMLRSLAKARYSSESDKHFGLATKFYCHFTSPIRRYPDLMIHRIIKEHLKGLLDETREKELNSSLPEIAQVCSQREREAEDAEREIELLKKVEFMKQFEGRVFKGIISGVTSFGIFVVLDNTVEGLVRLSDLDDDYYIYNEKLYSLIGERTRKTYRIGDEVVVQLVRADLLTKQIDFMIVDDDLEDEDTELYDIYDFAGKENIRSDSGNGKSKKTRKSKKDVDKKVLDNVTGKRKRKKK